MPSEFHLLRQFAWRRKRGLYGVTHIAQFHQTMFARACVRYRTDTRVDPHHPEASHPEPGPA